MKANLSSITFCLFSFVSLHAQWTSSSLAEFKGQMGVAAQGSKLYFGGGGTNVGATDLVEIYDPAADVWEIQQLSKARAFPSVVSVDSKVIFAGGMNFSTLEEYATVDIFDTLTQTWSTSNLSAPGFYLQSAAYQHTALFAGFYDLISSSPLSFSFSNLVNKYDSGTGVWSTDTLSQARGNMGLAVVGDLAIFAGGQTGKTSMSNRVDIYNFTTGAWSTASLSMARGFIAAATVGKKALFAGGTTSLNLQSDVVDIYDSETGVWSVAHLSVPRSFTTKGGTACDKVFFAGGGKLNTATFSFTGGFNAVDIYDAGSNTWSTDTIKRPISNHSVAAVENHLVVAGGVWFTTGGAGTSDQVEIYTCDDTNASGEPEAETLDIHLFPNPGAHAFQWQVAGKDQDLFLVQLYDMYGRQVKHLAGQHSGDVIHIAELPVGAYTVKISNGRQFAVQKLVKWDN